MVKHFKHYFGQTVTFLESGNCRRCFSQFAKEFVFAVLIAYKRARYKFGNTYQQIGHSISRIDGIRLPFIGQAMQFFFYQHDNKRLTVIDSACENIRPAIPFWRKAGIPTTSGKHAIGRLEAIFKKWTSLRKNVRRGGALQHQREDEFDKLTSLIR